jgi:hypothetical protein
MINRDMTERIQTMMTRIHLNESNSFNNIVALTESDISFLRDIGLYIYEGYKRNIKETIDSAKMDSNLFDQLQKQSQLYLKDHEWVYWNEKSVKESYDVQGLHLCSLIKEKFQRKKGVICRKRLNPDNVVLYLPIIEDWINYYRNTCKEGIDRQMLLDCINMSLKPHRMNKFVIVNGDKSELVDSQEV